MPLVFSFRSPNRPAFECAIQCGQCTGTAANGARCKKRACIGVPKCWMHLLKDHSLRIKPSTVAGAGKGLFAMKRDAAANAVVFKKDQKIIDYHGEPPINQQTLTTRYGDYTAPYAIQIGTGDRYENSACRRGVGALANHRSNPNAKLAYRHWPTHAALLKAIKNIRNGQEILVSYGGNYTFNEQGVSHRTTRRRTAPA